LASGIPQRSATLALLFVATAAAARGPASDTTPRRVPEVRGTAVIDGVLDDDIWNQALVIGLDYETNPDESLPAPVETKVLLVSSPTHLYAAFVARDPDPSRICASLCERDRMYDGDRVNLTLDTFNGQRSAYMLFANPLGVQGDALDTSGIGAGDTTWDAIWDSAGQINETGYVVEIAVPFSSLRFQRTDGDQIWGLSAARRYPRDADYRTATEPRNRDESCYLCQIGKVIGFTHATPGRNLEIDPTLSAISSDERPPLSHDDFERAARDVEEGVTARWGLTPSMALSGTLNPDFSQVEADALELDVNRQFPFYYEEKRPFFYEGMELFTTRLDAVYTRSVADPSWGTKLTGREGHDAVGAFVARDEVTNLIFPGSQGSGWTSLGMHSVASVVRYRRDVGTWSNLGALYTDRRGDEYVNQVAGLDGALSLGESERVEFQALRSRTDYPDPVADAWDQPRGPFEASAYDAQYDHSSSHYEWWLASRQVGGGFRSDVGFRPRTDFRQTRGGFSRYWRSPGGRWFSFLAAGGGYVHEEKLDGALLQSFADFWANYEGPSRSYANVYGMVGREGYRGVEYDRARLSCEAGYWPTPSLSVGVGTVFGDQIDYENARQGAVLQIVPQATYRAGRLDLALWHVYERLNVDVGRLYTANVSHLRCVYQFTRRVALRVVLQHADYRFNTAAYADEIDSQWEELGSQVLVSYQLNPRTVLYLGYSDSHSGNETVDLTQSGRTVFAKIGYAWVL
jgi:hypothetical protein